MIRKLGAGLALCLYAVVGLAAAAGVWEAKSFTEWTDKETEAILSESPWAGKGSLTNARAGGSVGAVPDWKVTITWRSGLPIRQALLRQQIGPAGKVTPEQQAALTAGEAVYIVAVDGLPGMFAASIQAIGAQTSLLRDGKPPVVATQGLAQLFDKNGKAIEQLPERATAPPAAAGRGGGGRGFPGGGVGAGDGTTATLLFGFPKSDPITAADKDVEFSTTIGAYHLKRKFHVKDMTLNGEPSL